MFFCTGAVGMGYEFVWIRKAALVVGASQMALATVLTAFFLGLGLGSWVVGRHARNRRRSPLVTYGCFEIAIGAFAFAFPWLFGALEACYGALYPLAAGSDAALLALRFVLLVLLFLPPTFLMGGTLPLLLDGLVADDRRVASSTGMLYAINIAGAVAGVLLTCYVAIPTIGLHGTSLAGGAVNTALGVAALYVFRSAPVLHPEAPPAAETRRFGGVAFLCGLVAIGWQVAWARYFSLLDVATIYSTAMLLAVYLLGLSLGGVVLAAATRGGVPPLRVLAVAQLGVPIAALAALDWWQAFDLVHRTQAVLEGGRIVPLPTQAIDSTWAVLSEHADTVFLAPLLKVGAVVLLPVVLFGVGVPALIAAAAGRSASLRATSGWILWWNTAGAAAGAALTGYFALPVLGLHGTLGVLALGSLAIAGCAAFALRAGGVPAARGVRLALGALAVASAGWTASFVFGHEDITRHTVKYHGIGKSLGWGPIARSLGRQPMQLGDVIEGPIDTCFVFEDEHVRQLCSGCVSFASVAKTGISGQAVQGHLPALFFPGEGYPRRCLGICLGSGQSLGALLLYDIEKLDVVDVSPSVVELSLRRFAEFNHGLGSDPRVTLWLDDGRHFVQRAAAESYDVVSMEPPPPDADGVHSLYSLEFYRAVRRALTDDGVFMQWLPIYRVTPADSASILATLAEVFPETFLLFKGNQDLMTLSYKRPPRFVPDALVRRCATFARERNIAGSRFSPLCRHEIASLPGLLSMLLAAPADVRALPAPAILPAATQLLSDGTGDRGLLPRYRGNQLGQITFGTLPESDPEAFAGYFDPPLPPAVLDLMRRERAAAMQVFQAPRHEAVAAYEAAAEGGDPAALAEAALRLAAEQDRALRKAQAFDLVATALDADPEHASAAGVAIAQRIVANHFAVYAEFVRARVQDLIDRFPGSPLVAEMHEEFEKCAEPERARRGRYWLPSAPLPPLERGWATKP